MSFSTQTDGPEHLVQVWLDPKQPEDQAHAFPEVGISRYEFKFETSERLINVRG